jgi:hypothetical protein
VGGLDPDVLRTIRCSRPAKPRLEPLGNVGIQLEERNQSGSAPDSILPDHRKG